MYKLIIVDDEKSIRQGMAKGNPWAEWGFEVVATAGDGLEAMEKIQQCKPDVVLSDIRMPYMDGVELMKYLNLNYPEIKIIILSGYNDFEYLNMSIKNNVAEYLLKPTDTDEFQEVFQKIKGRLDEERKRQQEFDRNKVFLMDSMLKELINGHSEEMEVGGEEVLQAFRINPENCLAVLFYIDRNFEDGNKTYEMRKRIVDICNAVNQEALRSRAILDSKDRIVMIIGAQDKQAGMSQFIGHIEKMFAAVEQETGLLIYAGAGNLCKDVRMIPQSYEQAVCAAHQKVFRDTDRIAVYRQITIGDVSYKTVAFQYDKIISALLKNDRTFILEEINRVFLFFQENMIEDYGYIEYVCLELLFYLSRWSLEHNIHFERIMSEMHISYDDIRNTISLERRREMLVSIIGALRECVSLTFHTPVKNNNLAQIIKECVDSEYMENSISLEYIADKVNKSAAYVSKLFKDEFGCNFSEYVTRKRLEKSREYLVNTPMKIYEIAEKTGYADVSNFIKVFKKKYGISPGDYRNFAGRKSL